MDEHARSARRAFIRRHHPDRGGDPASFAAGLRQWDAAQPSPVPVTVVPSTPWLIRLVAAMTRPIRDRHRPPRVH